jgi:hypothetical protein
MVFTEYKQTPGIYFPAVDRSSNQDISASHYPLLVPALRGIKASALGVTDFSVTVSGSVITFLDNSAANAMLSALYEDAIVSGWLNAGEDPGEDVADFSTASTRRSVNVAGTDYAITAINKATRQVTVSGTPASGTQTACVYPYRVAGSSTTARLLKLTGFVPAGAGDADGELISGLRRMDRIRTHAHTVVVDSGTAASSGQNDFVRDSQINRLLQTHVGNAKATTMLASGGNRNRDGKTTDPRSVAINIYTWAQVYVP